MADEAGSERMDWFSLYERLYTMNISTGRSTEPIGLEKYLDAVMAELEEQLPEEPDEASSPAEPQQTSQESPESLLSLPRRTTDLLPG